MARRATAVLAGVVVVAVVVWAWRAWWPDEKGEVRRQLHALAHDFNESTSEGLGTIARAARLGTYFTDEVVVELGKGSPPIRGRETLIGMASRLQSRTSAFRLDLLDVNVELRSPTEADVRLTAAFRRAGPGSDDGSVDAQEVTLQMLKADGEWRINHIATVDPFR